jgi:hypothetical protein
MTLSCEHGKKLCIKSSLNHPWKINASFSVSFTKVIVRLCNIHRRIAMSIHRQNFFMDPVSLPFKPVILAAAGCYKKNKKN